MNDYNMDVPAGPMLEVTLALEEIFRSCVAGAKEAYADSPDATVTDILGSAAVVFARELLDCAADYPGWARHVADVLMPPGVTPAMRRGNTAAIVALLPGSEGIEP